MSFIHTKTCENCGWIEEAIDRDMYEGEWDRPLCVTCQKEGYRLCWDCKQWSLTCKAEFPIEFSYYVMIKSKLSLVPMCLECREKRNARTD